MQHGTRYDAGFFSTHRVATVAAALVVAGMAVPSLRDGSAARLIGGITGAVDRAAVRAPGAGTILRAEDRAKTIATQSRMRAMKAELCLWSRKHGVPGADGLAEAVGRGASRDAWGRRIRFQPPTPDNPGWMASLGPDGVASRDDISLTLSWNEMQ